MNMRKWVISLLIIAILSLCTLNAAAASTNRSTSADHGGCSTGVTAQQQTMLTITAPTQSNLNVSFYTNGTLTVGGKGIAGATVHFQMLDLTTSNWQTLWDCKTDVNGQFSTPVFLYLVADYTFRAIYDGNSQYASSVSNEVIVTVS
ncbi:MAG: hypothetical protein WCE81_01920 [Halobacteriota archaeon]